MGLAVALGGLGVKVTYVAQERMSFERKQQGWLEPKTGTVLVKIVDNKQSVCQLVAGVPEDSIHICQGIRANGLVSVAQSELQTRGLTQWVIMETVRDVGWRGVIKRIEYARLFRKKRNSIAGVLATGHRTPDWVVQRGVPAENVFPFAYFLEKGESIEAAPVQGKSFRFIFVGQFISRKRLDWLIAALGSLVDQNFELVVIGSGALEDALRKQAEDVLGNKVVWLGLLPSNEVRHQLAKADCLVLPSLHDGWGAVVSEALLCGTPAICSDTCGCAGVVERSNVGGVFRSDNFGELGDLLIRAMQVGRVSSAQRIETIAWSDAITAKAGALYLVRILTFGQGDTITPRPPWEALCRDVMS